MQPIHNDPSLYRNEVIQKLKDTSQKIIAKSIQDALAAIKLGTSTERVSSRHNLPNINDELNGMEKSQLKVFNKLFELTHNKEIIATVENNKTLTSLNVPSFENPEISSRDMILTYYTRDYANKLHEDLKKNYPQAFEDNTIWE